jgi:site-specific DNA recombinase
MKTKDTPKQYVIYSRKSKFTGKGESIENQIELCRQYIAMHFGEEAAENVLVYEDEGFSGGNLERPQFKKMMKDSQKIAFAAIVVYRLDRISRNIGDFAKLIEDLGDRHIDFISIREQFDTSSPMGRAMMYIASVFSQLERETIAERIRDNMHELSKTGRWLGGTTPTGYASESLSSVTVDGKVKKACKLKPIPEEIQLVKTIFSVFMETGSLSKTDQYLLEHRCVTKRGKQFTRFAIRGILTNPVYMIADETAYQYLKENNVDLFAERSEFDGEHGVMAYNRTLQRPGKANQIRPMEEWIVAVGKHPGIIAGSDWVRVQAMLDVNKSKSYRRPRSNVALLSGLLRCGECGDYMRPKLTNRKNAEGDLIYTYMCSTKERSHGTVCAMKNCNGNTLDAKIIEEIRKLSADKETLARLLAQTKKVISGSKEGYDAELALLREKHAETEERIKRLVESLSVASDTSAKYVMEQIDALHQESETQQLRLAELEALTEQSRMLHQEFAFHQEMIESFASAVDSATLEEKRRLLRTIVKKVVWDGKNAYVYLFAEDGEADLPPIDQPMYPLGEDSECYPHPSERRMENRNHLHRHRGHSRPLPGLPGRWSSQSHPPVNRRAPHEPPCRPTPLCAPPCGWQHASGSRSYRRCCRGTRSAVDASGQIPSLPERLRP